METIREHRPSDVDHFDYSCTFSYGRIQIYNTVVLSLHRRLQRTVGPRDGTKKKKNNGQETFVNY